MEKVITVPRAFPDLAAEVALHRSEDRFDLLYRLLWRMQSERDLLKVVSDRDVADAMERAKNVSRASHKMKAFVRFRQVEEEAGERWIAWFEPAHRVLEKTAPFFQRRFTTMRWTILTPDGTADWDGEVLSFGPEIADIYFLSTVPLRLRGGDAAAIAGFALAVTLGACLIPAARAVKLDPATALRYE